MRARLPSTCRSLIGSFCDPRIRLFINDQPHREVYSFGQAIRLSRNAHIFFADQDDVWLPGRVGRMSIALERAALVTTNFEWIDDDGNATGTVSRRSLASKLWSRAIFARALLQLLGRRSTKSRLPGAIAEAV